MTADQTNFTSVKKEFKISPFSQYVVRTPLFPLSFYLELLEDYTREKAISKYRKPIIKETLNLASPELTKELNKWADIDCFNGKTTALELTLLKYIARMSSRCTPFGLFAGCSVGKIGNETNIVLELPEKHKRFTQFDMQFWVALLQNIATRKTAMYHLKYYPNSSIYEFGSFYRYVEYKHIKITREHSITGLRKSKALKEIIRKAKSGLTIEEIVLLITEDDSEKEEATKFIIQLIDFQFLISELDSSATGNNNESDRVLSILKKIPDLENEYQFLETINKHLLDLDNSLIPTPKQYSKIKEVIEEKGFEYDEKYLFQTDLNTTVIANNLNQNTVKKVSHALKFLNGIQPKYKSDNLKNFVRAFSMRYESQEMPLMIVLDTEAGLGYPFNQDKNDSHELLENFSFKPQKKLAKTQNWTLYDTILEKKLQECYSNKQIKIDLSKKDFPDFDANFDAIPATFSVLIEAYNDEKIAIESSGNVSAAKLLGRFCNGNSAIHNLTKEIIQKEEAYHTDKILAEIVHIPQSRTGNILRRPILRNHEIAYLANSGVKKKNTIALNDLYLSVKNDKIILLSKKLNKEIIPCLSNAHYFSHDNSLPLYHFLCDLQSQNSKPIFSFSWGVLESHYSYFPRVEYNQIILSKARWIIKKADITRFLKLNDAEIFGIFSGWRTNRSIPRFVNLIDSDNTLLIDFQAEIGVRLFLKSTQNKDKIILEEFLFTEGEPIVKNSNGEGFTNQFIVSFYKEQS